MRVTILLFVSILALPSVTFAQNDAGKNRVNNSFVAFTIPEKDLFPESIAYDPVEEAF